VIALAFHVERTPAAVVDDGEVIAGTTGRRLVLAPAGGDAAGTDLVGPPIFDDGVGRGSAGAGGARQEGEENGSP